MKQSINLNAELQEWLNMRLSQVLGENPDNILCVTLNLHEAKDDIFRIFYDYQVLRQWPHIAERTAQVLGMDRRTIYRKAEK